MTEQSPDQDPIDGLSFEKAMSELESIVDKLERGEVSLEESIAIYERGEALKKRCDSLLQSAEMKIEAIRKTKSGAADGTEPMDLD